MASGGHIPIDLRIDLKVNAVGMVHPSRHQRVQLALAGEDELHIVLPTDIRGSGLTADLDLVPLVSGRQHKRRKDGLVDIRDGDLNRFFSGKAAGLSEHRLLQAVNLCTVGYGDGVGAGLQRREAGASSRHF